MAWTEEYGFFNENRYLGRTVITLVSSGSTVSQFCYIQSTSFGYYLKQGHHKAISFANTLANPSEAPQRVECDQHEQNHDVRSISNEGITKGML